MTDARTSSPPVDSMAGSIATSEPVHTSIANLLPAVVAAIVPDRHPSQALVRLHLPGQPAQATGLLARVTRRSVATLQLQPGEAVWAQVKAAAHHLVEQKFRIAIHVQRGFVFA